MRLLNIIARGHPAGNRIDLAWKNPNPAEFPGVRVVRREGTHPTTPDDGAIVAHGTGLSSATDSGLRGETLYHYALFPFKGSVPQYEPDPHNRVCAMATSPYGFAELMYALLPMIYRRHDARCTPLPGSAVAPEDQDRGVLRRFLDLPGSRIDWLYSLARAALNLCDLDQVDGSLLPLLAQWIGWETDYGLELDAQRSEIRFAPHIYRTIGLIPAVEATVKRISGWESRTKEFVFNVARTNQPERLNLWSTLRDGGGTWGAPALASLNWVYEGRPAAVRDADGSTLFFYHTYRRHGWDIWSKRFSGGLWQPSEPALDQPGIDKHPAAAVQDQSLWLFWEHWDETAQRWQIQVRTRESGDWSAAAEFDGTVVERRLPAAAVDPQGGLWLFWLEPAAGTWQIRYNRHDGTKWQLATPAAVPLEGGQSRAEDDLFVVCHPSNASKRIWLFWARQEPGGPAGQTRWTVVYRVKKGLDPAVVDWLPAKTMPKADGYHDREPAALLDPGGNLELFWSSTQKGGWSVWRNSLDVATEAFGAAQQITTSAYSERAPLVVDTGSGTLLAYRSNESLKYQSAVYGATHTLDARYAGTTTVDVSSVAKLALRGRPEDFLTYTYDAGEDGLRTDDDRIARDTIGLYLAPTGADPDQIKATVSRLRNTLSGFMPATSRAVLITP